MRVFCDTNVLASAFGGRGLCGYLVERLLAQHTLVVSPQVLDELARALPRLGVDVATTKAVVAFVRARAVVVPQPTAPTSHMVRDEADRWILAAAVNCDALVTGDTDLLDVANTAPVRILNPRALWTLLDEVERARE